LIGFLFQCRQFFGGCTNAIGSGVKARTLLGAARTIEMLYRSLPLS